MLIPCLTHISPQSQEVMTSLHVVGIMLRTGIGYSAMSNILTPNSRDCSLLDVVSRHRLFMACLCDEYVPYNIHGTITQKLWLASKKYSVFYAMLYNVSAYIYNVTAIHGNAIGNSVFSWNVYSSLSEAPHLFIEIVVINWKTHWFCCYSGAIILKQPQNPIPEKLDLSII